MLIEASVRQVEEQILLSTPRRRGAPDSGRPPYDGPLSLATDNMVWNITKAEIVVRMAVSPDQAWAVPGPNKPPAPIEGVPDPLSDFIKAGKWPVDDAQGGMIQEFKKEHGLK